MPDVRIATPRGVTLAGTIELPDGAAVLDLEALDEPAAEGPAPIRREGLVILAHDFLTDRHGLDQRLDRVGCAYRQAGLATLAVDFSGLGESDDDVITAAGEVEDLRALCGWAMDHGWVRQAVHANGLGATVVLLARPEQVSTAVLVGAVVGPQSILWEEVFSPEQLDELDRHGLTRLPDDMPNSRQWDVISKETLADMSLQTVEQTMADLPWPVLMIHGGLTDEFPDSAAAAAEGFALLQDGSQLVQVHDQTVDDAQGEVARLGVEWVTRRLR